MFFILYNNVSMVGLLLIFIVISLIVVFIFSFTLFIRRYSGDAYNQSDDMETKNKLDDVSRNKN